MQKTIGLSLALLVVSTAALAKQAQSAHEHPVASLKAKSAKTAAAGRTGAKHRHAARHATARHATARDERRGRGAARQHAAGLPPVDQYVGPVRVVGKRQVGSAAWYGGKHLGLRTASGERLDAVHATAAHRSLPLHTLVRVTNLKNGRSVICKINDRGPVSHSLLIDVSPRVAEELDMKRAGIAKVSVEPVEPAPAAAPAVASKAAAPPNAATPKSPASAPSPAAAPTLAANSPAH